MFLPIQDGSVNLLINGIPESHELITVKGKTLLQKNGGGKGGPRYMMGLENLVVTHNICNSNWENPKNNGLNAEFKVDKYKRVWEANIEKLGYCNVVKNINADFNLTGSNIFTVFMLLLIIGYYVSIIKIIVRLYKNIQQNKKNKL